MTNLQLPYFCQCRIIAKFRCSDLHLEIEKDRHKKPVKTPRDERFCRLSNNNLIETEEHLLAEGKFYDHIKGKYDLGKIEIRNGFIDNMNPGGFGQYLIEAFELRKEYLHAL
jgi:hypothetical protein